MTEPTRNPANRTCPTGEAPTSGTRTRDTRTREAPTRDARTNATRWTSAVASKAALVAILIVACTLFEEPREAVAEEVRSPEVWQAVSDPRTFEGLTLPSVSPAWTGFSADDRLLPPAGLDDCGCLVALSACLFQATLEFSRCLSTSGPIGDALCLVRYEVAVSLCVQRAGNCAATCVA